MPVRSCRRPAGAVTRDRPGDAGDGVTLLSLSRAGPRGRGIRLAGSCVIGVTCHRSGCLRCLRLERYALYASAGFRAVTADALEPSLVEPVPKPGARDALVCVLGEVLGENLVCRERFGLQLVAFVEPAADCVLGL